jgi:tetratricopeptide (TPR) repeat protein
MKLYISLLTTLVISFNALAQKKELKAIQKLVDEAAYAEALTSLGALSSLIETAEPKYTAHYYYLAGVSKQATKEFSAALDDFNLVKEIETSGKSKKYTTLIDTGKAKFTEELVNHAIDLNSKDKFAEASDALYLAYTLDKENNLDYLYFAARSAVNLKIYDKAMEYYQILKSKKYTGITKKFYATEVATGEEIEINENTAKIYAKSKDFTNIREQDTESRLPEIVKNIALIYSKQGSLDKAKKAFEDARLISPNDAQLLASEANFYFKEFDDLDKFVELSDMAVKADPNNHIIWFNLGVVYSDLNNYQKSYESYQKSIEVNEKYYNSYLNLAALILDKQIPLRDQFDNLGYTKDDDAKREKIRKEIDEIYLESTVVYNRLLEVDPKNRNAIDMLKKIYYQLDDMDKFKKYRDMLEAL